MTLLELEELLGVKPLEQFTSTPWQDDDLNQLVGEPSTANWSEMGCYKTSTALWLAERNGAYSTLVITTKAGKGAYYDIFHKCLPDWRLFAVESKKAVEVFKNHGALDISLGDAIDPVYGSPHVVLAHYDCFTNRTKAIRELLTRKKWDMIIVDEAHRLKSRDTQWTKAIKKLKAPYRHIMTGTGFINNPAEIWSLLNFLDKTRWSSYWNFRNAYCDEYIDGAGFRHIRGIKPWMVEEFRSLRRELGPRRMMADVHAGIGHPIEAVRTVDLNTVQRRMYNEIKSVLQTLDQQGEPLRSPNVLSQLNRLRQISVATPEVVSRGFNSSTGRAFTEIKLVEPSSKLDETMDIISQLDEPEQQIVVFSAFRGPLDLLEERLNKASIPYLHMQQKHNEARRYEMWHDLWPQKEHKVFMSTLALGGESINLTSATHMIFLDRSWSPKDMMQAIGRIYRPGQKGVPEIIYINASNTTDQYMKAKLDIKGKWFQEIFGD